MKECNQLSGLERAIEAKSKKTQEEQVEIMSKQLQSVANDLTLHAQSTMSQLMEQQLQSLTQNMNEKLERSQSAWSERCTQLMSEMDQALIPVENQQLTALESMRMQTTEWQTQAENAKKSWSNAQETLSRKTQESQEELVKLSNSMKKIENWIKSIESELPKLQKNLNKPLREKLEKWRLVIVGVIISLLVIVGMGFFLRQEAKQNAKHAELKFIESAIFAFQRDGKTRKELLEGLMARRQILIQKETVGGSE